MSEDMSDMIKKVSDMLKNNEIPDDIKNMMNNFANKSDSDVSSNNTSDTSFRKEEEHNSSDFPNIDFNTMLKMKSIIDSMNQQQNDPRANLLKSLKPYLKTSRKEKVDQYIKLFSMGKVFEVLNPLGGEKKNDI